MCFVINPKSPKNCSLKNLFCIRPGSYIYHPYIFVKTIYVYTRGHLRSMEIHHAIALDGRITSKREVTKGKAELIGGLFGSVQIEALMEEADWEVGNIYSNFCPFN